MFQFNLIQAITLGGIFGCSGSLMILLGLGTWYTGSANKLALGAVAM